MHRTTLTTMHTIPVPTYQTQPEANNFAIGSRASHSMAISGILNPCDITVPKHPINLPKPTPSLLTPNHSTVNVYDLEINQHEPPCPSEKALGKRKAICEEGESSAKAPRLLESSNSPRQKAGVLSSNKGSGKVQQSGKALGKKRAENKSKLAKKKTTKSNSQTKPGAISRSTLASRQARASLRDGTFVPNPEQVHGFKDTILTMDLQAEFRITATSFEARHFRCGVYVKMKEPYNASRFDEHIGKCRGPNTEKDGKSNKLNGAGMRTDAIRNFLNTQTTKTTPAYHDLPCPGLTDNTDHRVSRYLKRSAALGGGASNRTCGAKLLFDKEYGELSDGEKKQVVELQTTEHQWRNFHSAMRIVSVGCEKMVTVKNSTPSACQPCRELLSLKAFQNALNHPTPSEFNFRFTSYEYRPKDLGLNFARTLGCQELLDTSVCDTISKDVHLLTLPIENAALSHLRKGSDSRKIRGQQNLCGDDASYNHRTR